MSQGKPGCEIEFLERLKVLVSEGELILVVPEIVHLELEGQMQIMMEKIRNNFGNLKKDISKTLVWTEIEDSKQSILQHVDELRDEKIERWRQSYDSTLQLLSSEKVSKIPYTADIMCRARKRIIRKLMPDRSFKPEKSLNQDQDAAIIESLINHFSTSQDAKPILLFCSENHLDFAIELPQKKGKDRVFALHPTVSDYLPPITFYFTRLEDLILYFDKEYESLPQPYDKEIQEAQKRIEEMSDFDSEEYWSAFQNMETLINSRLGNTFISDIVPNLPEEFRAKREAIVNDIQRLLQQCRQCASWDDKSELKLSSWLEFVPEEMIPFTSLSNQLIIKGNLQRYLSIHLELNQ